MLWPGFSPPHFPTKLPAVRTSSCPPVLILTQLPKHDDEFASLMSDSYISELLGVMDDCLLSGAESSSVMAPQEAQRQSSLPSASHSGQVSGVAHNRKIVKKSVAQVVKKHPEDCSVTNAGTLAVKLARHSFFGNEV